MRGEWGDFDQGSSAGYREYMDFFNENVLICPMIETTEAVANIHEIASVPGVDICLIGRSDLSITHDVPLDYTSDKYIETLKTISAACAKNNVVAGMYFQPPGLEPATLIEMGYRFFVREPCAPRRPCCTWGPLLNLGRSPVENRQSPGAAWPSRASARASRSSKPLLPPKERAMFEQCCGVGRGEKRDDDARSASRAEAAKALCGCVQNVQQPVLFTRAVPAPTRPTAPRAPARRPPLRAEPPAGKAPRPSRSAMI